MTAKSPQPRPASSAVRASSSATRSGSSATPPATEGTLARIVEVEERTTVLRRTADDDDPYERPIVANADQLVIVTALADPPPRTGMIDRILVAGYDAGIAAPAVPDQGRPRRARRAHRRVRAARRPGPGDLPRLRSGRRSAQRCAGIAASSSDTPGSASRPW